MLYEKAAALEEDPAQQKAYYGLAYESWYRSRAREELDFYAKCNTGKYEDEYGFKAPQKIIDQVNKSRKSGSVYAAPEAPPNVRHYLHDRHDEQEAPTAPGGQEPQAGHEGHGHD